MQKPKEQEMIKTTIRVPKELWDKIRIRGIEQGISAGEIVVQSLGDYLKKGGS
jgi:hypothetical protein